MENERYIMMMEIFYMKVIILMILLIDTENMFTKMVYIIQANLKIIQGMAKEKSIIPMEKLSMKVITLIIELKYMEKIFMKIVNIIQANLKII